MNIHKYYSRDSTEQLIKQLKYKYIPRGNPWIIYIPKYKNMVINYIMMSKQHDIFQLRLIFVFVPYIWFIFLLFISSNKLNLIKALMKHMHRKVVRKPDTKN